ncbi:MAG: mechanosensitive ion channel family protein [Hyphomicrobium sp.]
MEPLQLANASRTFIDGLTRWAVEAVPNILAALVLFAVGVWFSGWVARQLGRGIDREERIDPTMRGVLTSLARYGILIVTLVAVLGQLGVQTTSILAALGAAGLAIGLALQGTLSNIAAGMMLLWLRPYRVGDFIDAGGVAGTVKEVGLFATEMHSWDGVYQFVPNSELWNKRIINYNRLPTRLVEIKCGIGYNDDIDKAKAIMLQLADADMRVLSQPAPTVFVSALQDSSVEVSLRAWAETADYFGTLRDLNESCKKAFDAAGISIPFPQLDVHLDGALARAIEPSGKPA